VLAVVEGGDGSGGGDSLCPCNEKDLPTVPKTTKSVLRPADERQNFQDVDCHKTDHRGDRRKAQEGKKSDQRTYRKGDRKKVQQTGEGKDQEGKKSDQRTYQKGDRKMVQQTDG
jgi:hypothetical protein